MTRSFFGGTSADWLYTIFRFGEHRLLKLPDGSRSLTFWAAAAGGTRLTDLLLDGAAVTAIPVDGYQIPRFQGPDNTVGMWADKGDGTAREYMEAQDLAGAASLVGSLSSAVRTDTSSQGLTSTQRGNARSNIGAALASDVDSIKPSGGVRAVGKSELRFNVRDYGAVGDGVTDDMAAFQAAINAAFAAGGGTVFIPRTHAGVGQVDYMLGTPGVVNRIQMKSNVSLESNYAVLTKPLGASNYDMFACTSQGNGVGYGAGGRNIRVSGIHFKGSFPGTVATTTAQRDENAANQVTFCAFAMHHVSNMVIENCVFEQAHAGGHLFDMAGCEKITIRNNRFLGMYAGVNMINSTANSEAIQIDGSFVGSTSSGEPPLPTISYDSLYCREIRVEGNEFLPITVGGVTYPCSNPLGTHLTWEGRYHENIWFSRNYVLDPVSAPCYSATSATNDGNAFRFGVLHFSHIRKLHISQNTFRQTKGVSDNRATRVISISATSSGGLTTQDPNDPAGSGGTFTTPVVPEEIFITNNTFHGFNGSQDVTVNSATVNRKQEMIYILGLSNGVIRNVTISGNTFRDGYTNSTASSDSSMATMVATYVDNLSSVGNTFVGVNEAYHLNFCSNVTVSGDIIRGPFWWPYYFYFCTNVTVQGITVTGWGRPMTFHECNGVSAANCQFREPNLSGGDRTGISLTGSPRHIAITGCVIANSQTAQAQGISVSSTVAKLMISGCVIYGFTTPINPATAPTGRDAVYANNMISQTVVS